MLLLLACAHGPSPTAPPAAATGIEGAEVLYFDLEGADRIDLIQDCAASCPRDESGTAVASLTSWAVDWTWTRRPFDPCAVDNATVNVDVTVTLPRWSAPSDAAPALVEEWRAYLLALTRHEQGHVDIVHAQADGSEERLAAAGCARAHDTGAAMLDDLRGTQHAYDAETAHGRRQGANFWRLEGRGGLVSTE